RECSAGHGWDGGSIDGIAGRRTRPPRHGHALSTSDVRDMRVVSSSSRPHPERTGRMSDQPPPIKLGVIAFHPMAALRERFYAVVGDLQESGSIVDVWLMDIAAVLLEHGYVMEI